MSSLVDVIIQSLGPASLSEQKPSLKLFPTAEKVHRTGQNLLHIKNRRKHLEYHVWIHWPPRFSSTALPHLVKNATGFFYPSVSVTIRNFITNIGKTMQLAMCLPCKHEDPSSDPRTQAKRLDMKMCILEKWPDGSLGIASHPCWPNR